MEQTLEQKEQLKKWASERDAIVSELHLNTITNQTLSDSNKTLKKEVKDLEAKKLELETDLQNRSHLLSDVSKNRLENSQLLAIKNGLNQDILELQDQAQLKTWTAKRDAAQKEIMDLQVKKEKLTAINNDLALSHTDLIESISKKKGILEEITKKEGEVVSLVSKEVSALEIRKTTLETEITSLTKIIELLTNQKTSTEKDVTLALKTFEVIDGKSRELEKIYDKAIKTNEENKRGISEMIADVKTSLVEMVEVNKKNVEATNVVVEKLPKMLMEAQRHGLIKNKI